MRPAALRTVAVVAAAVVALGALTVAVGDAGRGAAADVGVTTSPGCGRAPAPGPGASSTVAGVATGDVPQTLAVDGTTRTYRLAVPPGYRPDRPVPLVLLFHGSGSDAVQTTLYTGLPAAAAGAGMLVATPDALGGRWALAAPGRTTVDVAFVAALERDLSDRYCVDPTRVFAAGISLGSEFAVEVGCTARLHVAAVALVAAEYVLAPCVRPLPVLAFHGTADPVVAYRNGATGADLPGVPVIGVQENLAGWARHDGCRPRPRRTEPAPGIVLQRWRGCLDRVAVTLYTVVGGGHTWPGSPIHLSVAAFGPTTERLDATARIVAFFGRRGRVG